MGLREHKETIAQEVCSRGTDCSITSKEAATKILNYLVDNYTDDVSVAFGTTDLVTEIIREYRKGLSLEDATNQIIDASEKSHTLNGLSSWEGDLSINVQNLLPFHPIVPSIYSVGRIEDKNNVLTYNQYAWIECLGQNVFVADQTELYWHIKNDITAFESYVNGMMIISSSFLYMFTESIGANGAAMFNIPDIPGFIMRTRN